MKLDKHVQLVSEQDALFLCKGEEKKHVEKEDRYIFQLLEHGRVEDKRLSSLVAEKENLCEVSADLRLVQIALEYGNFLAPVDDQIIDI